MEEQRSAWARNDVFSWERSTRLEDELLRYAGVIAARPATREADVPERSDPAVG